MLKKVIIKTSLITLYTILFCSIFYLHQKPNLLNALIVMNLIFAIISVLSLVAVYHLWRGTLKLEWRLHLLQSRLKRELQLDSLCTTKDLESTYPLNLPYLNQLCSNEELKARL